MEILISLLFGLILGSVGVVALTTYLLSPMWMEHIRLFAIGNLFWAFPFFIALPPWEPMFGRASAWIANASDTIGSVFVLAAVLLVYYPCERTCVDCSCTDCRHKHVVCLVRLLLVLTVFASSVILSIAVTGAATEGWRASDVVDFTDTQLVNSEFYDWFFASTTTTCTAVSGVLLFRAFCLYDLHPANLLGVSFVLFSLSDSLQPLYAIFCPAGYYEDSYLWLLEWGLALLGLLIYTIGCLYLYKQGGRRLIQREHS